jgi:hypothetical protein
LLEIVSKFGIGGGVDDSILWLSFAQQKWRLFTVFYEVNLDEISTLNPPKLRKNDETCLSI